MPVPQAVTMRDVKLIFRNFRGEKGKYNQEGARNFSVLLPDDIAEAMAADDWAVKWLDPREEDEDDHRQAYIQVKIKYGTGRPPVVAMITSRGRRNLDESDLEALDYADIIKADLIIRPFEWNVNGKTGIAAYLKSGFFTIEEDELEAEYNALDVQ